MNRKHILIAGAGSVGKRHARNLATLGCAISTFDPRVDRREELRSEVPLLGCYTSLEDAFAASRFDGVVIGSPPSFHVDQSIAALHRGAVVLLEKPISATLEDARRLEKVVHTSPSPLLLGYTWRWWPPFATLRKYLTDGSIGSLRHVRFIMSAHLADWHPWERYQDFFMSDAKLGGGALLDESHWIDIMLWLFGMPETVSASIEHISDLEITADDNVDLLFRYPGGLRVSMHLDLYGRPHEKSIRFIGERGSFLWTDSDNSLRIAREAADNWQKQVYTCERNDMFAAVAREFTSLIESSRRPSCTVEDGLRVLRVIEAARISQRERRLVAMDEIAV